MPCVNRRTGFQLVLGAAILLVAVESASAVVVYKRGATQPVAGYLVREDDREVVLRQSRADGRSEEITVSKEEIEDLIHTVDLARLAALDPARPHEYREYADELAEKKLDPEAREAAMRLYVIAADLFGAAGTSAAVGGERRAHAAMLGLIALARSSEEEARFRAAAYLADPRHDPALLKSTSAIGSSAAPRDPAAKQKLLEAVHHARRGKGDVAGRLVERPEIGAELEAAASIVTKEEFQRICRSKELDDDQLRALVKLELALESALAPQDAKTASAKDTARSWSQLLGKPQSPLKPLNLEHLTEFDPKECVYREGKWVEP